MIPAAHFDRLVIFNEEITTCAIVQSMDRAEALRR